MSKSKKPTSSKTKLLFFGNERIATAVTTAAPTLQALIDAGYEIEAVVASHVDSISRQKRDLEIGIVAHRHNIPVILLGDKIELIKKVKKHPAEMGVLVAFGRIIPQGIIDLFPKGIINIHPSLLPMYRGSTPLEAAMLNGAIETGVSIMHLSAEMDAGPVFAQARVSLNGSETKQELADRLSDLGAKTLVKILPAILDGSATAKPQDEKTATYSQILKKEDGILDWAKPAQQLEREVRAYAGWPRSITRLFGHKIIVTKARVTKPSAGDEKDKALIMRADPGWLEITELIAPSGRKMSGADFLRGYKN
ncbi:methionyl-tRNA formyltransferase [Candidatus Saccharibacteria bacterium]|nr:methionyl-tRNA formyltransferase [Candidatus Saccharibacteria bacterium]